MSAAVLARTPAQKRELIDRLIPTVVAGIKAEDDLSLRHELERYEAQEPSYLSLRMRSIVRSEMSRRAAGAVA